MSASASARREDSYYDLYDDYDDFGLDTCGKGGGSGGQITTKRSTKQGSDQGPGKVYSSKHVRLLEARRDGRKNNNNTKKSLAETKIEKVADKK